MKLNQATAVSRRVGPIRCVDGSGTPVTSGFGTAGAVEISVNDGPFVAALGSIVVIGGGYVYYQATLADASVEGFFSIKLEGICEESTIREEVQASPQGILVAEPTANKRYVGPLRIIDGDWLELATVAGITCEISRNGAAWTAAPGVLSLIEAGYANYAATALDVATVGWIAIKLTGACQEYVFRTGIVDASGGGAVEVVPPTITLVSPVNGASVYPDTPLVFDVTDASGFALIIPMIILDPYKVPEPTHNTEDFEPLYSESTRESIAGGYRYTIRRNHGWYASPSLLVWAVDFYGNVWTGP